MVGDPWRDRQRHVLSSLRGARTQEDVARGAGLKFWRYVNLETGKVEMLAREVPRLAESFEIAAADLATQLGVTVLSPQTATENLREQLTDAGIPDDEIRDATSEARALGPNAHPEADAIAAIVTDHHERAKTPEKRRASR